MDRPAIFINLYCPECRCRLNGEFCPRGDCPSCGHSIDVPELAIRQWDRPWYLAPGFTRLIWPPVWLWFCALSMFWIKPFEYDREVTLLVFFIVFLVWLVLMLRAIKITDNALGLIFALILHILATTSLISIIGMLICVFMMVVSVIMGHDNKYISIIVGLLISILLALLLVACICGERLIAKACIRDYFRRNPFA